jgi:hypothetical protein
VTDLLPVLSTSQAHGPVMAYGELFAAPPNLRFGEAGVWCPMCRGALAAGSTGWACLPCGAEWTLHGLGGRWSDDPEAVPAGAELAVPVRSELAVVLRDAARRVPRIGGCARIRAAAVLLAAGLVPAEAVAAQSLYDGRLVDLAAPGVWCWLLPLAASPTVVALLALMLGSWHRLRRHPRSASTARALPVGGARCSR